jgi:hypothetical protein
MAAEDLLTAFLPLRFVECDRTLTTITDGLGVVDRAVIGH